MNIYVISIFPDLFKGFLSHGLIAQALKNNIFSIRFYNPRDYVTNNYKSVDDSPYGGGDGMVMAFEPLEKAYLEILKDRSSLLASNNLNKNLEVLYLSPKGEVLDDQKVKNMAKTNGDTDLVLVCGRYAGLDQRFIHKYVDKEISIGDYVLSGGELPAMVLIDAVLRHIPKVLGNPDSAQKDSFLNHLLEAPVFTKPEKIGDLEVPFVLKSGNHKAIENWREALAYLLTRERRPDLLKKSELAKDKINIAENLYKGLTSSEKELLGLSKK